MIRIGTAGWALPAAVRDAFREGGSVLERYSRVFTCAEINSSFHRPHRRSTYERWASAVPDAFRFCVKMPKEMTHRKRCVKCEDILDRFLDEAMGLGGKLQVLLMQFPPKFSYDDGVVPAFLHTVRARWNGLLACEPRHATWFDERALATLSEFDVTLVRADPPPVPYPESPNRTGQLSYRRLHGVPRTYYSSYEAHALEQLARELAADDAPDRWVIFDNTASGAATANALALREMLEPVTRRPS